MDFVNFLLADDSKQELKRGSHVTIEAKKVSVLQHILVRIVDVPPQLHTAPDADLARKRAYKQSYDDLRGYLKKKLEYDCKNICKCLLFVYKLGALNMSPPPVVASPATDKTLSLDLCFGTFDEQMRTCTVERPYGDDDAIPTFMNNVDWSAMQSIETLENWRTLYLLAAQFVKTCVTKYTDFEADPCREPCLDSYNREKISALAFRDRPSTSSKNDDGDAIMERRVFDVSREIDVLNGPKGKLKVASMDRVYKILKVADDLTFSSIDAFGESVGGHVLAMVWNDQPGTGHSNYLQQTLRLVHLPVTIGPTLLAIASGQKSHPTLLPRLETTFSPAESGYAPCHSDFKAEGGGRRQGAPAARQDGRQWHPAVLRADTARRRGAVPGSRRSWPRAAGGAVPAHPREHGRHGVH